MKSQTSWVLDIFRQEQGLAMILVDQAGLVSTVRHLSHCPVSFAEVDTLCSDCAGLIQQSYRHKAGSDASLQELKKICRLLWDMLLAPAVKGQLKSLQGASLVLSIDETLIHIPWELLYDGGNFLCLRFSMGRLVRTNTQFQAAGHRCLGPALKMLVLADPTDDLPDAYREGLYIKECLSHAGGHIAVDFKSTAIDTLYVKKNLSDYDIVHFAGHCDYNPTDNRTLGWVLKDGQVTAGDVMALGQGGVLPALVFSNSCHSASAASGYAHGWSLTETYPMARAFLFSGVRHYIGTAFKIEDESSLVFAKEFYRCLDRAQAMGDCLLAARRALIRRYGMSRLGWAGYILYGDPAFSLVAQSMLNLSAAQAQQKPAALSRVAWALAACIIFVLVFFLSPLVPSMHPRAYFLFRQSQSLLQQGNVEKARNAAAGAIKIDDSLLVAYPILAESTARRGDFRSSLQTYYQYALASEKKRSQPDLAEAYIGIGWVYQRLGNYPQALDFYSKALALATENRDILHEGIALRKLALWHNDMEHYDQALVLLTKSSELNRQRGHDSRFRYNLACDYFDIGLVMTNKDDYAAAKQFYQKSKDLFAGMTLELGDYFFNLGEIYLFEKQYARALECYAQGLRIDTKRGDKPNVASDYGMIGQLYMEMGDSAQAEKSYLKAREISEAIDAPLERAESYYNLGLLYKGRRQNETARQFLTKAQAIYKGMRLPAYQEVVRELAESAQQ